ncbi:class I SAM-dependent methyltransferase [Polaribacter sp.]|uniref:class I SAM-dependent methyltransferase n=1 Tax=Polaribacter sp. TaxID=1920175 RepID=UPI003F6B5163
MTQIYEQGLWGTNNTEFYSGEGSHNPDIVNPYVQVVKDFLSTFKTPLTLCDLGCGDFNIGKQLVKHTKKYIGVDIVESLINYNTKHFKAENLSFLCLDIAKDPLPKADVVILRQVLQHLSNTEILSILQKLRNYKYILLTEHIPNDTFAPNKDIISGQGIRIKKQSGLDILKPPFNFKVVAKKELLAIDLGSKKGVLVTTLYQVF